MHRAYTDSPHNAQGAIKAVYDLSYTMSGCRTGLRGMGPSLYTSGVHPKEATLHVYSTEWNSDNELLQLMKEACCE